ncbi:MAG TPA: hypothetical protein VHD36_23720 [Pirellulales bacterium]|nr:hypothetical protein [Pirellulales bacterium]
MRQSGVPFNLRALLWAVGLLAALSGCAQVRLSGKSPLMPAMMAGNSVALEKCTVRFAHADPQLDEEIWSEIDEEFIPLALRTRLAANGFRVGVIGSYMPAALETVLRSETKRSETSGVADQAVEGTPAQSVDEHGVLEPKPVDLLHEPKVRRSLWQTRPGHPGIIVTAGERARIPQVAVLLRGDDGHVTGRTYERVLASLSMKATPERDGRVRVEVLPQLEHGDPRSRFVAADGMIKPDYRPESVLFKELEIDTALSPGQTLILGTRASKPGSLGSHFFTEKGSEDCLEQKLLLVRVVHAPDDDRFRSDEVPPAP